MAVPFGFSLGDFIAVGKLIKDVIGSLKSVGGAKSQYQDLLKTLELWIAILHHIETLEIHSSDPSKIKLTKNVAFSCIHELEQFLQSIRRFDASLGPRSHSGGYKAIQDKVVFGVGKKDEVKRLQYYLDGQTATIHTMLAFHGLETMSLNDNKTQSALQQISVEINEIDEKVDEARAVLDKYMVLQLESHSCIVEIHEAMTTVDARFTWAQEPLRVEDALGKVFPFPSELPLKALENALKSIFDNGPGARSVQKGGFELCRTDRSSETITSETRLLPGMAIKMAIIVGVDKTTIGKKCPKRHCRSRAISSGSEGGFRCDECGVWFDRTSQHGTYSEELVEFTFNSNILHDRRRGKAHNMDNATDALLDDEERFLRNVRAVSWEDLKEKRQLIKFGSRGPPPIQKWSFPLRVSDAQQTASAVAGDPPGIVESEEEVADSDSSMSLQSGSDMDSEGEDMQLDS